MRKLKHQCDYIDTHRPSLKELKDGELKEGDLITNIHSQAVWNADRFDVETIKPETFETHRKFRKMIPIH